jgi:hypothetical protein
LKTQYGTDYPIFPSDLGNTSTARVFLSRNAAAGKIARFASGIYYFPRQTRFGNSKLPIAQVYERKYIDDDGEIFGYYSGLSFQQKIGYTSQVPNTPEITTNKEASLKRTISLDGKRKVLLKRPRVQITVDNCRLLPLLDLITAEDADMLMNNALLSNYIQKEKLRRSDLQNVIAAYPAKTSQKMIETGLIYEFLE